jgi:hypothetical protein
MPQAPDRQNSVNTQAERPSRREIVRDLISAAIVVALLTFVLAGADQPARIWGQ